MMMSNGWTEKELNIMRVFGPTHTAKQLTLILNKGNNEITSQRRKMGIRGSHSQGWTQEETDILTKYGSSKTTKELAELLPNRTTTAIQTRKHIRGITYRPELCMECGKKLHAK